MVVAAARTDVTQIVVFATAAAADVQREVHLRTLLLAFGYWHPLIRGQWAQIALTLRWHSLEIQLKAARVDVGGGRALCGFAQQKAKLGNDRFSSLVCVDSDLHVVLQRRLEHVIVMIHLVLVALVERRAATFEFR